MLMGWVAFGTVWQQTLHLSRAMNRLVVSCRHMYSSASIAHAEGPSKPLPGLTGSCSSNRKALRQQKKQRQLHLSHGWDQASEPAGSLSRAGRPGHT